MKKYVITSAVAALCASVAVGAQTTPGAGQQNPAQSQPATQTEPRSTTQEPRSSTQASGATTTLVGCVYKEADVPGRSPNVAERAGVLEDYILVASQAPSGAAGATSGAVGTSGSAGSMFKLEHADDERLRAMVGKRVEVTGKIDREASDQGGSRPAGTTGATAGTTAGQQDRSLGPDQINLPEFEISSIRETSGDCPATPSSNR